MSLLNEHYIDAFLPEDFFSSIGKGLFRRDFYPPFSDRNAWRKAAGSPYAGILIKQAEIALHTPVPPLSYEEYTRFIREGNRADYEKPYFKRREILAYLALGLCLTGDEKKYMPSLLNCIVAILEEWTWCVPAHMTWNRENNTPRNIRPTDLFCSETGCVMASLLQILGQELEREWEGISEWIRKETLERTVYNVMNRHPEDSMTNYWVETESPQNWTIWCSVNNLYIAVICEKDPEKLELFAREFVRLASRYISGCFDDGYCPEGPTYYTKAAMMLFRMLDLLDKIRPGSMKKLFADEKIRNIFEFIAKVKIGKDHLLAFADGSPLMISNFSSLMPAASAVGSARLLKCGHGKISDTGAKCNGDFLIVSLALLFDYPEDIPASFPEDDPFTLFPGRLAILRSDIFSAALKAGNNLEPHNHLDLGHFTIYADGEPVIVDAGTGVYTKQHFSPGRYDIWYLGAKGHNAPVFGESAQIQGADYTADFPCVRQDLIQCDLSDAYPEEAGIKRFIRTLDFKREQVIIEDDFELEKPLPASITLFAAETPEQISENLLKIGRTYLLLEGLTVKNMEEMPELTLRSGDKLWNKPLTAVRLAGNGTCYRMIFRKEK